ncbi:S8 family serine peptidase [Nocardioides sp. P5_C9_2]
MTLRRRGAAGMRGGIAAMLALGTLCLGTAAPAHAADGEECNVSTVLESERLADTKVRTSAPMTRMHVPEAHEVTDGSGVTVAVVDSGIQPGLPIDTVPSAGIPDVSGPLLSGHGTIVAGLIAGTQGVAPGATVIDMRVLDTEVPDYSQGQKGVTSQGLTAGIRQLIALRRTQPFSVVNISLSVGQDDPNLRAAIKDLLARDVVVVASAGNADPDAPESFKGTPRNDAQVYPADYPGVLAVSAVAPDNDDLRQYVAPNKDTDVAAPTYGGLSYNITGQKCLVTEVATSWAAAEVTGVVALLRAAFPDDNAKQIVGRLKATAEGSDEVANPWTGAGVVQAHDALTRALTLGRSGKVDRTVAEVSEDAMAPPAPQRIDLFGSSRTLLLWAGLLAGALMALAFILRPLARR